MSSPAPPVEPDDVEYDPTFLHSRREAVIIFGVWLAALLWTLPYCYFNGYVEDFQADKLETIWGIPSWVLWGVAAPWLVANVFTTWFCFCYMKDDDLGETHEGANLEEEIAEMHAAGTEADA
jgi:hypothetical protein